MKASPKLQTALANPALKLQRDDRLVELARNGHEAAFEAIVARYRRPLIAHCRRMVGDDLAQDVVQQAFTAAHDKLRNDRRELHLRAWLYQVATNLSLNTLRQKDSGHEMLGEETALVEQPGETVERSEDLRTMIKSLRRLPERERHALLLKEAEGRSFEDIAEILGGTPQGVKQLTYRARRRLRDACSALVPVPVLLWLLRGGKGAGADKSAAIGAGKGIAWLKVASAIVIVGAAVYGANAMREPSSAPKDAKASSPVAQSTPTAPSPGVAAPAATSQTPTSAVAAPPPATPTYTTAPQSPPAPYSSPTNDPGSEQKTPKGKDNDGGDKKDSAPDKDDDSGSGSAPGGSTPGGSTSGSNPGGGSTGGSSTGGGSDTPPPDTTAPETTLNGPSGTISDPDATFDFDSSEANSTFECRLDSGAWTSCSSPHTISSLVNGSYEFNVRATDAAGNTDQTPAAGSFSVSSGLPSFDSPDSLIAPTPTVSDTCASSIASGDLNGDGRSDLVVGCPFGDPAASNSGNIMVFIRNTANDGFDNGVLLYEPASVADDNCGASVAAGDVNGDGRDDVAMGCPGADAGPGSGRETGQIVVFTRNAANTGFDTSVVLADATAGLFPACGTSVSSGDVNDDGRDDLIMGCPYQRVGGSVAGGAVLFTRNAANNGFDSGTDLPVTGSSADNCGYSVASGDVNNDGRDDVAVGCLLRDGGATDGGSVSIFTRNTANTGFDAGVDLFKPSPGNTDFCGESTAMGDVNGDGRDDVAMGCAMDDAGSTDQGSVTVFTRNASNNDFDAGVELANPSPATNDRCGRSTAIGDVTADGRDDVLAGCYLDDPSGVSNSGSVAVFTRNLANDGFSAGLELPNPSPGVGENCGTATAASDVNGDGANDVAMGCPGDDRGAMNAGAVELFPAIP